MTAYSIAPEAQLITGTSGPSSGLIPKGFLIPTLELFFGIGAFVLTATFMGPAISLLRGAAFFGISFIVGLTLYVALFIGGWVAIGIFFQEAGLAFLPFFLLYWPEITIYSFPVVMGAVAKCWKTP